MYIKNSNLVIYVALAAIVGFGLSFLFTGLDAQSGMASGDISKAVRYNNQKEDPALTVIEEKLRNDAEFLYSTKSAMEFLQERMAILSELTEETIAACEGKPEFESLMTDMKSLNAKSYNTMMAMTNAGKGLDKLVDGKSAPEYEIYSNQAYIGFNNVESQMSLGREFYESAVSYLKGKEGEEYEQIADLASIWAVYTIQDSYLNSSDENLAMLSEEDNDSNSDSSKWEDDNEGRILGFLKIRTNNSALGQYVNEIATVCGDMNAAWKINNGTVGMQLNEVAGMQLNEVAGMQLNEVAGMQLNAIAGMQLSSAIADFKLNDAVIGTQLNSVQTMMIAAFPNMDLNSLFILQSNTRPEFVVNNSFSPQVQ